MSLSKHQGITHIYLHVAELEQVHSIHPESAITKQSKIQSSGSFGQPARLSPVEADATSDDVRIEDDVILVE